MYKIGFSSCCFPPFMPIEDIIKFCIDQGFNALELEVNDTNFNAASVKSPTLEWIKKLGTQKDIYFSMHSPGSINFSDPDPEKRADAEVKVTASIHWAAELGVKTIVVHPGRVIGDFTQESWKLALNQNITAIKSCAQLADLLGVTVSVENLCHEKGSVNPNISKFFEMCTRIGLSHIKITLDTNHAGLVDGLAESVKVIGPYVNHIHFSSNKGTKSDHCEPQVGVIDFYSIADFLKNFKGMIIIELNESGEDSAEAILRTREYLVKLLNAE